MSTTQFLRMYSVVHNRAIRPSCAIYFMLLVPVLPKGDSCFFLSQIPLIRHDEKNTLYSSIRFPVAIFLASVGSTVSTLARRCFLFRPPNSFSSSTSPLSYLAGSRASPPSPFPPLPFHPWVLIHLMIPHARSGIPGRIFRL